jgi:multiple sugar transport system substrate-binding protein
MQKEKFLKPSGVLILMLLGLFILGTTNAVGSDFNWRKHEGTTIRVLMSKSAFTPINLKITKDFEAISGVKVQVENYPSMQLRKKVLMELGGGNKDLDVFAGMMKMAYQFENAGWLEPLAKYIDNPELTSPNFNYDDFFVRTRPVIKGKIVGITGSTNPQVLIYRKDLFEQHGIKVPTNWKELEEAAKKLTLDTTGDGKTDIYGWIARMNDENSAPFANFLYNNGATYLDKDRNPVFNSPKAIEAMKFYGHLMKTYGPPGGASIGWKEVVGAMAQGKAAMTVEISIFAKLILENPKRSKVAGKLGYAAFPSADGSPTTFMLPCNMQFMNTLSEKKEAAWLYMHYSAMKDNLMKFQMRGLPMARKSCWKDSKFKANDKLPGLSKLQYHAMQNGIVGFELQSAGFAEARPLIERTLYTAYEDGDVQKAADEAVKGVKDIMRRTGEKK